MEIHVYPPAHPVVIFCTQVTSVTFHWRTQLPCLQCRLPQLPQLTPSHDFFVRWLPQLPFTGAPSYPVYSAGYLSYPSYPPAHPVVIFLYAGYLSYLSLAHPVTLFTVQVTSVRGPLLLISYSYKQLLTEQVPSASTPPV